MSATSRRHGAASTSVRIHLLILILTGIASWCHAPQLAWAQGQAVSPSDTGVKPSSPQTPAKPVKLRLSMHDAMHAAVGDNPTVQLLQERITQAEGQAFTQRGTLLPNLSARVSGARRRFFLGSFGGSGVSRPMDFYEGRAAVTQNIFSLSLIQKWRAARTNVEVATLDAEITKMDTMAIVGLAYLEALRAQKAVDARLADAKLNKALLRLSAARKAVGMATRLDVTRARVQFENEKQRLIVAKNDTHRARLNLSRAIGLSSDVELILTDRLTLTDVAPQTIRDALHVAEENRVELKAQKKRKRLAELTLSSVTMERLPSLTFSGDVGVIGNQPGDAWDTETNNLQFLASIPIFDGGQWEGRVSESRSLVRQEDIRTRDIEYQVALEVRDAMLTLASTRRQVGVAKKGLRLALQELNLARQRFAVGVATNIEVTDAQTSVAQARDNLIEALFNFNASRVDLARAQGRLEDL